MVRFCVIAYRKLPWKVNGLTSTVRRSSRFRFLTPISSSGKKDAEGNTIEDERGLPVAFFAPDDPSERDAIEAEKDARERTGGARPGEQIGLPGFGQEE